MALPTPSRRLLRPPRALLRPVTLVCGLGGIHIRSLSLGSAALRPLQPLLQRHPHPQLRPQPQQRRLLTSFLSSLFSPSTSTSTSNSTSQRPSSTHHHHHHHHRRHAPQQTLHARRLLPYPAAQLYTVIADIDSYRFFLPHCTASRVTAWTTPTTSTTNAPRWPALADLTVGWGPFTQSYTSRVYCVPGSVVEAVSGAARTAIPASTLQGVGYEVPDEGAGAGAGAGEMGTTGIFESLVTRWTVRAVPAGRATTTTTTTTTTNGKQTQGRGGGGGEGAEWTEVSLSIQYRFANPALGFAVGQMADDKVDEMVQAFEDRARRLYGRKT